MTVCSADGAGKQFCTSNCPPPETRAVSVPSVTFTKLDSLAVVTVAMTATAITGTESSMTSGAPGVSSVVRNCLCRASEKGRNTTVSLLFVSVGGQDVVCGQPPAGRVAEPQLDARTRLDRETHDLVVEHRDGPGRARVGDGLVVTEGLPPCRELDVQPCSGPPRRERGRPCEGHELVRTGRDLFAGCCVCGHGKGRTVDENESHRSVLHPRLRGLSLRATFGDGPVYALREARLVVTLEDDVPRLYHPIVHLRTSGEFAYAVVAFVECECVRHFISLRTSA